ncbi:hypothetical protein BH09VER1_BH09VER1_39650 [soil metagenome]
MAQGHPELPSTPSITSFLRFAKDLDLTDQKIGLEPKQGDGSSAYFKLKIDGKTWGAILPDNSANLVYGEILSFNLARALGRPELCGPAVLKVLEGKSLDRFTVAMREAKFVGEERLNNQQAILGRISQNPEYLETVLKIWGPKPYDVDELTTPDDKFNTKDRFADFLNAQRAQPSTALISLPGIPGKARECDLANQLSSIFLIDALTAQADRFSKGNINAIVQDDVVSLVAYDNGGTWDKDEYLALYLSWVTRFDRDVAQRILALNGFLNGKTSAFLDFHRKADLRKALGLETEDAYWQVFKDRLAVVARHIKSQKGDCFFEVHQPQPR